MRFNLCCTPRPPQQDSAIKRRLKRAPAPVPPPADPGTGIAVVEPPPKTVKIREDGKKLLMMMAPAHFDKKSVLKGVPTPQEVADLGMQMHVSEQAAVLHALRKDKIPLNEALSDGAVTILLKQAASGRFANYEGVRVSLFFGLAACADAPIKTAVDAGTLITTLPPETVNAQKISNNMREAAYALALACRIPVELILQRYDLQIKRQNYVKLAGKALNIVAGTFPWTGGAGTLAESGIAKLAELAFDTSNLDMDAVMELVEDHCKLVSEMIETGCPAGQEGNARNYAASFIAYFEQAWKVLGRRSNRLRRCEGKQIELGFAV